MQFPSSVKPLDGHLRIKEQSPDMCMVLNVSRSKLGVNTKGPTSNAFLSTSYFSFSSHRIINCTGRRYCSVDLMVSMLGVTTLGVKMLRVTAIKNLQSGQLRVTKGE